MVTVRCQWVGISDDNQVGVRVVASGVRTRRMSDPKYGDSARVFSQLGRSYVLSIFAVSGVCGIQYPHRAMLVYRP